MTPDEYCQQKAAASGSSFYYSFLFLPAERRRAITALYAFCREVDDVVDEASEMQIAAAKLAWWRAEIANLFAGNPQHPGAKALQVRKHSFGINIACQASKNLFVSANLKTFSKRTDLFFDPITYEQSTVELKAYALLDLYAEYKFADGKLKVCADAKNITNSKYTEVYGFNTLGFNINAGISFKL